MKERLDYLREIGEGEGIKINEASQRGLINFSNNYRQTPEAIFLRDNGNLAAHFWFSSWRFSIEFVSELAATAVALDNRDHKTQIQGEGDENND